MNKSNLKINNPLTVIAIFSMLTEASAAVSLPYINSEHQKIYVWFLVIFPSLLTMLFFLTLNFNNKKLYPPTDLSKAEAPSTANTYTTGSYIENIPTFKNIAIPTYAPTLKHQPGLKLNTHTPHSFVFLPQGHRIYDPDAIKKPTEPKYISKISPTERHVLIEDTELKNLHFIDLTALPLQRVHKLTPKEVLHSYYKSTRKHKNNSSRPDVLFLLLDRQSDALLDALKYSLSSHKSPNPPSPATLITYNLDSQQMEVSHPT